jgi:hypothetical protein
MLNPAYGFCRWAGAQFSSGKSDMRVMADIETIGFESISTPLPGWVLLR